MLELVEYSVQVSTDQGKLFRIVLICILMASGSVTASTEADIISDMQIEETFLCSSIRRAKYNCNTTANAEFTIDHWR